MQHEVIENVFGHRGTGKTTLCANLVADCPKVLAYDPQDQLQQHGYRVCRTRSDVHRALKSDWNHDRVRVAYVPELASVSLMEEGHFLASLAATAQQTFKTGEDPRPMRLLIDEAHTCYPNHAMPKGLAGLDYVVLQGRNDGIGAVFATQRPANLNGNAKGNVETTYALAMPSKADRRAVTDINSAAGAYIDQLDRYEAVVIRGLEVGKFRINQNGTMLKLA